MVLTMRTALRNKTKRRKSARSETRRRTSRRRKTMRQEIQMKTQLKLKLQKPNKKVLLRNVPSRMSFLKVNSLPTVTRVRMKASPITKLVAITLCMLVRF